jgi:hypothetical protein
MRESRKYSAMKKIVPTASQFQNRGRRFLAVRVILLGGVPKRRVPLRVTFDSRERSTYVVNEGSPRAENE